MDIANSAYDSPSTQNRSATLVKASTTNDINKPVFYIHRLGSDMYLTVRGSTSTQDWITNVDFKESSIDIQGAHVRVHSGFYKSAKYILQSAKSTLLAHSGNIYFTGHSLGASVATVLLALALNDTAFAGKSLSAVTFGAAPSLSYLPAAVFDRIATFIHASDIIPTLSINNAYVLFEPLVPSSDGFLTTFLTAAVKAAIGTVSVFSSDPFASKMATALGNALDVIVAELIRFKQSRSTSLVRFPAGHTFHIDAAKGAYISACKKDATEFGVLSLSKKAIDDHPAARYLAAILKQLGI